MKLRLLALLALAGCADPRLVKQTLDETNATIVKANGVYGRICAPEELANAESGVAFTLLEFDQGDVRRAQDHVVSANDWARRALEKATPCGTADRDKDAIVDIIDQCPDEPEDKDGVEDEDGCRDIDPNGDEDGDKIKNMDDACMFDPEDFDQDADEDGCPETSYDSDGDGFIDPVDQCPKEAEDKDDFADSDGCPDTDDDNDTILDMNDQCKRVPEDMDLWEDTDGCPDPDNDNDGLADGYDQCPNEPGDRLDNGCPNLDKDKDGIADGNDKCPDIPETVNQYLDEDGCPDAPPKLVVVTRERIEIKERVQFATGSATLLPASSAVLNDVATALSDAPHLKVRVEGHTDSDGNDDFNLKLSQDRADSVRAYLIGRGIDPARLESVGYGETKPIDTNRTSTGKANNRRVEFHITEQ